MIISLKDIKHEEQRYETVGDWVWELDHLIIHISDLGDEKMNACIAIHELIEALLCRFHGVTQQEVDAFDMGLGKNLEDPGESPLAPYHKQHMFASGIELVFAQKIGVDWNEYEKKIKEL